MRIAAQGRLSRFAIRQIDSPANTVRNTSLWNNRWELEMVDRLPIRGIEKSRDVVGADYSK